MLQPWANETLFTPALGLTMETSRTLHALYFGVSNVLTQG
jgi:hypothetical protein